MVMNRRLKKQFWELRRHRNVLNYVRFPIGFYKASFHQLCVKWQSWDGFQKHTGVPWPHCGTGRCSTAVLGGNQVPQTAQDRPIPIQKNSSVVLHQWGEVFAQLMAKYSYCIRAGFPFLQSASTTFSETSFGSKKPKHSTWKTAAITQKTEGGISLRQASSPARAPSFCPTSHWQQLPR